MFQCLRKTINALRSQLEPSASPSEKQNFATNQAGRQDAVTIAKSARGIWIHICWELLTCTGCRWPTRMEDHQDTLAGQKTSVLSVWFKTFTQRIEPLT